MKGQKLHPLSRWKKCQLKKEFMNNSRVRERYHQPINGCTFPIVNIMVQDTDKTMYIFHIFM